jgi:hypothetical protein
MKSEIELLVGLLDEAFDSRSWHGPNLRGAVRGVSAREAAWRPGPDRHNIWEFTLHAAYWKYVVRRRLSDEKRGSFALKGSNFFLRPAEDASEKAWHADIALLIEEHERLRAVVKAFPARRLAERAKSSQWTNLATLRGIAAHDLYHAGQIQLLKRLARTS